MLDSFQDWLNLLAWHRGISLALKPSVSGCEGEGATQSKRFMLHVEADSIIDVTGGLTLWSRMKVREALPPIAS